MKVSANPDGPLKCGMVRKLVFLVEILMKSEDSIIVALFEMCRLLVFRNKVMFLSAVV